MALFALPCPLLSIDNTPEYEERAWPDMGVRASSLHHSIRLMHTQQTYPEWSWKYLKKR